MTRDFAVVGTGTGVGKTVVTAGLVGMLRDDGVEAKAIKPCQTGYPPDDDAEFVANACGTADASTCLRRLSPPLAPEVAARQEGVDLSYDEIVSGCTQALSDVDCGVVEGIGGLRVPLASGYEVIDLIEELGLPAIVVAHSGLGTLNHTALTIEALERRSIAVSGVVLNEYETTTAAERTNPDTLKQMTDIPIQTLPPLDLTNPSAAVDGVTNQLPQSLLPG